LTLLGPTFERRGDPRNGSHRFKGPSVHALLSARPLGRGNFESRGPGRVETISSGTASQPCPPIEGRTISVAGREERPRELRVASSRIDLEDVSGRVLFPSPAQGPWIPFVRFAETVTTGGGIDAEGHPHRREEVVNYVLEGRVEYEDNAGCRSVLETGTVALLTAREQARHNLNPDPSSRARWVSAIVRFSPTAGEAPHRVQIARGPIPPRGSDGVIERRLVGPRAPVASSAGLECMDIEFRLPGPCVRPMGRDRRAVAYVLDGAARIGGQPVEAGAGALIENTNEVSLEGASGTRVFLTSAPR